MSCLNNRRDHLLFIDNTCIRPGNQSFMENGKKPVPLPLAPRGGLTGQVLTKCTDRDYDYHWDTVAGSLLNANNGLSVSGATVVQLGGSLLQNTIITGAGNDFRVLGTSNLSLSNTSTCGTEVLEMGNISTMLDPAITEGMQFAYEQSTINYNTVAGHYVTGDTCVRYPSMAFKYTDVTNAIDIGRLATLGDASIQLLNNTNISTTNDITSVNLNQLSVQLQVAQIAATTKAKTLTIDKDNFTLTYTDTGVGGINSTYNLPVNKAPETGDMILASSSPNQLVFAPDFRQLNAVLRPLSNLQYGANIGSFYVGYSVIDITFMAEGTGVGTFDYRIVRFSDNFAIATGTVNTLAGAFIQYITPVANIQTMNDGYFIETSNVTGAFDFDISVTDVCLKLKYNL